ncbi:MAG: hypothetical protein QXG18_02715 [Candidatus Pacearchaeota archaeon]
MDIMKINEKEIDEFFDEFEMNEINKKINKLFLEISEKALNECKNDKILTEFFKELCSLKIKLKVLIIRLLLVSKY